MTRRPDSDYAKLAHQVVAPLRGVGIPLTHSQTMMIAGSMAIWVEKLISDALQQANVRAERAVRELSEGSCQWTLEDHESATIWHTACGEAWGFIDGGPADNNARFCHGCGKPIDAIDAAQEDKP